MADWNAFWSDKIQPHHRSNCEQHFSEYGRELAVITSDVSGQRVLEMGCGSGSMFRHIGFDRAARYRGVDFSDSMLAQFRQDHPGVDLVRGDAAQYADGEQYDLIFSNTLVQYFNDAMLLNHLRNAAAMLAPGGRIVAASLPLKRSRAAFYMGSYSVDPTGPWIRRAASLMLSHFRPDPVGRWFALREIVVPAERLALATEIFGSMLYPYRFHARLRIKA